MLRFIVDVFLALLGVVGIVSANAAGHWIIATALTIWIAAIIWRNMDGNGQD
jgi:hypothetical protein